MEKNGRVRVSYEAKSKNPIDVGTFVFTVSVKLYMEVCVNITKIRSIPQCQYSSIFLYTGVCCSDVYREKYVIKSVQDQSSPWHTVHTFHSSLA